MYDLNINENLIDDKNTFLSFKIRENNEKDHKKFEEITNNLKNTLGYEFKNDVEKNRKKIQKLDLNNKTLSKKFAKLEIIPEKSRNLKNKHDG